MILVKLSGFIDKDWLSNIGTKCKIVLGHHIFTGEYKDALGTKVFFEKIPASGDSSGSDPVRLQYHSHTYKVLDTHRIFLMDKIDGSTNSREDTDDASAVTENEIRTKDQRNHLNTDRDETRT